MTTILMLGWIGFLIGGFGLEDNEMSIRTIIEINHDYLRDLEAMPAEDLKNLLREATFCNEHLNASKHGYRPHQGVTVLSCAHHSVDVDVRQEGWIVYQNYVGES